MVENFFSFFEKYLIVEIKKWGKESKLKSAGFPCYSWGWRFQYILNVICKTSNAKCHKITTL